jgi:hypothetical protein
MGLMSYAFCANINQAVSFFLFLGYYKVSISYVDLGLGDFAYFLVEKAAVPIQIFNCWQ